MPKVYAAWDQIYWPLQRAVKIQASSREQALQRAKSAGVVLPIVEEWNADVAEAAYERIRALDRKLQGETA